MFFFSSTIVASLLLETSVSFCFCIGRIYVNFFGNSLIFRFQGMAIQNLAVVSCQLLIVSVSLQGLDIQDLAFHRTWLVRGNLTPSPVPSVGFDPWTST